MQRRAAADADREPGRGVAGGGAASRADRLLLLRGCARPTARRHRFAVTYQEHLHQRAGVPRWVSAGSAARPASPRVIGWPVAHSLSPVIHNAAFAALEHRLDLRRAAGRARRRCPPRSPGSARSGFAGANVTMPHKEAVADADRRADRRRRAAARGQHDRAARRPARRPQHRRAGVRAVPASATPGSTPRGAPRCSSAPAAPPGRARWRSRARA